ncbi:Pycsar system effector family protein [Mesohalobacter halotolerans]|uniref:HD domain-containing protein n=1 Tax=Mesohalobacter halotolerans TaxID=1883405 RepID=A0A4U5TRQ6_9FLAO|nr:Pycsar system effector family protein [Mesohalobacter halotolerans]MBS3738389.1 HD domain-containing protein [Psychroflexus sp.]TKS56074.1 HD domain-containing protein [Mesohalobacter halotolerans]
MDIIKTSQEFVKKYFNNNLPSKFLYHNLKHTENVVNRVVEISNSYEELTKDEKEALQLAAWFHDTGYCIDVNNHETESQKIAKEFLKNEGYDDDKIKQVLNVIEATKVGVSPETLPEKIIKDADCGHFATEDFEEVSELLRQELKLVKKQKFNVNEWIDENLKVLTEKHQFYTDYTRKNWAEKKQENILNLINKKNKRQKKLEKEKQKAKFKARYKNDNPERSIQTLFRVALRNHIKLSDIADTKANILLSVNAIIISLALSNIIPKLDNPENQHLMLPTLVLVAFSVASILLSILATRPNVTSGQFTKEQVKNRAVNILFFGNFHKMDFDNYLWGINEILEDKDYVYEALTKDLYLLGVVLARKYKLLRLTYTTFSIGIVLSVISFVVAFWMM